MSPRQYLLVLSFSLLFLFHASAATLYVDLNSTNPVSPYADWSTAATNIQDAIDASSDGDLVLVNNGVYQTGGRVVYGSLTNRVVINGAITVQSVNGPSVTLIQGNSVLGSNAVRCVFMGTNSVLAGFTLTNGGTLTSEDSFVEQSGGGIWTTNTSSAIVSNCVLVGNVAYQSGGGAYNGIICNSSIIRNSAWEGGGVSSGGSPALVTNCLIWSNSATSGGGGVAGVPWVENCMVMQNAAQSGGGVAGGSVYGCLIVSNTASDSPGGVEGGNIVSCTIVGNTAYQSAGGVSQAGFIYNSIIYYNTVTINGVPDYYGGDAFYCCTTTPDNAIGNITNEPGFVDYANGDFHLASNSPCINGGNNYFVRNLGTDLDGNPRIVDGLVDMGACEYQTPGFILPYYWAQEYGLSVNDGAIIDPDGNGMNYWETAIAGLNPTNAASVLRVSVSNSFSGAVVTWPGVANKVYDLQRSPNLLANPAFIPIYTNSLFPVARTFLFQDNVTTNGGPYFYRVGVVY